MYRVSHAHACPLALPNASCVGKQTPDESVTISSGVNVAPSVLETYSTGNRLCCCTRHRSHSRITRRCNSTNGAERSTTIVCHAGALCWRLGGRASPPLTALHLCSRSAAMHARLSMATWPAVASAALARHVVGWCWVEKWLVCVRGGLQAQRCTVWSRERDRQHAHQRVWLPRRFLAAFVFRSSAWLLCLCGTAVTAADLLSAVHGHLFGF